ncbi:TniQ family protein [Burkholderia pseudomallei]|uniref:TniQ family protein n=1 Tax=Burkholderia pseudomallei TaxID=28450 RepID=UPI0035A17B80
MSPSGQTRAGTSTLFILASSADHSPTRGNHSLATRDEPVGRRFIFRPRPANDEHVLSYLLRLGEMNGYTGRAALPRFTRSMKLRLLKRDQIAAVARLVGLNEKVLLELLHRHRHVPDAHSRPSYFAIRCFFREPHTSYCPQCVRERGIFRAIWNFRAVTVCEQHGLWLVEQCPGCSEPVGWNRPRLRSCQCGFDLGQAETTPAPIEAALINKLLLTKLICSAESDLLEQQLFCDDARRMSALEWLAVSNFLATIVGRSLHFHPTTRAALGTERSATLLAARLFVDWPTSAMRELNRSSQSETDKWQSPLISFHQLSSRVPARYASGRRGVLSLPCFMRRLLQSYTDALTVHRQGPGLAINPSRVVASDDGTLGVQLRGRTNTNASAASGDLEFIPLPLLVRGIRDSNIVLHNNREVEQLIGATRLQRAALVRSGFLRPADGRQFVLSSEVDRFRQCLRENTTVATDLRNMVPLSALSPRGREMLGRVLTAVMAGRVPLFRQFKDSVRLDSCFVKRSSLVGLVR